MKCHSMFEIMGAILVTEIDEWQQTRERLITHIHEDVKRL